MPKYGKSLRDALHESGTVERGHGIVFYNGEDGNHAVYDVLAHNDGRPIVNGELAMIDGEPAQATTLPAAVRYFHGKGIETERGWNSRP